MKIILALSLSAGLALWNGVVLAESAEAWRVLLAIALGVAAYFLGRRSTGPRDYWILGAVTVLSVPLAFLDAWDWSAGLIFYAVGFVLPWFGGRFRRQQLTFTAAEARRRERERIAADMHDSLGHQLALIALRAGLLELTPGLGPEQLKAAAELRAAAGTATEQLRETIGLLRGDDEAALTPADETVEQLVAGAADAGVDVTLDRTGTPPPPDLLTDRAVHRVVQEAVTNAAKHAPGAPVRVRIVHTPTATELTVHNPLSPVDDAVGGGHGLIGLAERVRLAGGTFQAGPVGDGFRVTAIFPRGNE